MRTTMPQWLAVGVAIGAPIAACVFMYLLMFGVSRP